MPHEPAVAHVDGRVRIGAGDQIGPRRVIEVRHRDDVAAIHHVDDDPAARPRANDGQEQRHVGRELDATLRVAWGAIDVGDHAVGRVRRIDAEVESPLQLLVGPDRAERAAVGERAAQRDVEASCRHDVPPRGIVRDSLAR